MAFLGLFITIISGIGVVLSISRRLKLVEVLGLSFPVGMGLQTFLMVCLDSAGIRLTATSVFAVSLLITAGLGVYLYFLRAQLKDWLKYIGTFTCPRITWLWLLGLIAVGVVVVMNVAKTLYYPTFDTDSVRGFNLIGMAVANEGTIRGLSLFNDANYAMRGAGSYITYTPLTQLSYTYMYLLGFETSKMSNALFFISFIPVFYGIVSRFATHTLAALTTLLTIITPEMLGFSSMSGTNFIHAVYASSGILFFVTWYYKKTPSFLWIAAMLLMLNNWTRSEGLAFIGAACCLLLWNSIKIKRYKTLVLFTGLCLFPFVFWNLFLKIYNLEAVNAVILKPFWDSGKITVIITEMWQLFKAGAYYGISFVLFLIVFLSNIRAIVKKQDHAVSLLLLLFSWIFYTILIYQVDYIWDTLENVMRYSYKRFLFSFIPLLWFYIAANHNIKWLFDKADNFLFSIKPPANQKTKK
ncbi:MAG: hypothetical protein LBR10_05760 [Prevotellaceae bacterium]|jgi:hypothetical protein|nr:hypothetical protein [Prevotellaceae bacterium]